MGIIKSVTVEVVCSNCESSMAEYYSGDHFDPDYESDEDLCQMAAEDAYGAAYVEVSGTLYEALCENCWCETSEHCTWCNDYELVWSEEVWYCEDSTFGHDECAEDAHQEFFREFPDTFSGNECNQCAYMLRIIPGPKSDGEFMPIVKLKVSA